MAEAVIWMSADLNRPMAPVVFATDARGSEAGDAGGFGVVALDVGRVVAEQCAEKGMTPGYSVTRLDGKYTGTRREAEPWRATKPLSRLPDELLAVPHEDWADVDWGVWRFQDHISLGETRAVVRLARLAASVESAQGHRIVSLQDNEACSGALMKGRSPAPSLNHLARQKSSHCLAGRLAVLLPRVETYHQPADALSRTVQV